MSQFVRRDGVVAQRLGDHTVVLDSTGELVRTFNEVGALVWDSLPGDRDSILGALQARYPDVPLEVLGQDLDRFLAELDEKGLIATADT